MLAQAARVPPCPRGSPALPLPGARSVEEGRDSGRHGLGDATLTAPRCPWTAREGNVSAVSRVGNRAQSPGDSGAGKAPVSRRPQDWQGGGGSCFRWGCCCLGRTEGRFPRMNIPLGVSRDDRDLWPLGENAQGGCPVGSWARVLGCSILASSFW